MLIILVNAGLKIWEKLLVENLVLAIVKLVYKAQTSVVSGSSN